MDQILLSQTPAAIEFDGSLPVERILEEIEAENSPYIPTLSEASRLAIESSKQPEDLTEEELTGIEFVITSRALREASSRKDPDVSDRRLQLSFILSKMGLVSRESVSQFYLNTKGLAG